METYETLLVVEDEQDDVALLQRAFRRVGLVNPVAFVHDGEAAIEYLSGGGTFRDRNVHPLPGLVLLDLKLPRKSGLDVLAWLRDQPHLQTIPVVVLTSSKQSRDLEAAYALGANSYLVKPVSFDELLAMVEALKLYWVVFNQTPGTSRES